MNLMKYKPLLFNPRFLLLWIGSYISGIGDAVAVVVIIWTLYNQTFSPLFITLALICLELPSILLSTFVGSICRSFSKNSRSISKYNSWMPIPIFINCSFGFNCKLFFIFGAYYVYRVL